MADNVVCGCKGIRSCLICEEKRQINELSKENVHINGVSSLGTVYTYCTECCTAYLEKPSQHPAHRHDSMQFEGITIIPDFISHEEENFLQECIYQSPFVLSQSGRQKQDFGPKVNFKKKKLRTDKFSGLPSYARFLIDRMQQLQALSDFLPVELCNLEYSSDRGSAIDPHFDDFWLWGERLVTLNLLSDSVLYFTNSLLPEIEVHVPLLRRSLIVVSGGARSVWKHGIHRHHILGKRIAMTLRELTPEFLENGERAAEGRCLLDSAMVFQGVSAAES